MGLGSELQEDTYMLNRRGFFSGVIGGSTAVLAAKAKGPDAEQAYIAPKWQDIYLSTDGPYLRISACGPWRIQWHEGSLEQHNAPKVIPMDLPRFGFWLAVPLASPRLDSERDKLRPAMVSGAPGPLTVLTIGDRVSRQPTPDQSSTRGFSLDPEQSFLNLKLFAHDDLVSFIDNTIDSIRWRDFRPIPFLETEGLPITALTKHLSISERTSTSPVWSHLI